MGDDPITEKNCEKCRKELTTNMEKADKNLEGRVAGIEKTICNLVKPEEGALSKIHEKINLRPTWVVFWSIVSIIFILVFGSYSYNYFSTLRSADKIEEMRKTLATKEDVQSLKNDINSQLIDIKRMIFSRRNNR